MCNTNNALILWIKDFRRWTVETCKYIPYKNNDNVGQLKMLCSSSRVNHLHCEDDCTANDYNLKNAVICCVSLSNTVQLRSWAFALIAVSNTAEYVQGTDILTVYIGCSSENTVSAETILF